jgi:DNA-binding FadR family transcriptional regulator
MSVIARDVLFEPLAAEGAVEAIVRRVGEAIGAGLLAPGERLPAEAELAARLGVAPMTLRQALAVLRDAGFVETRRGRRGGTFVRDDPRAALHGTGEPPAAAQLRELTDWRRAVSGEAAALAADRATRSDVEGLQAAARAVESTVGEVGAFRVADARFHVAVAEVARSRRLVAAETALQPDVGAVLRFAPGPALARQSSQEGHGPIVAAIAAGDPAAARAATVRHVEATHDWVVGLTLGRAGRG